MLYPVQHGDPVQRLSNGDIFEVTEIRADGVSRIELVLKQLGLYNTNMPGHSLMSREQTVNEIGAPGSAQRGADLEARKAPVAVGWNFGGGSPVATGAINFSRSCEGRGRTKLLVVCQCTCADERGEL